MRVEIHKYGELLVSRPAGREALLAMIAYLPTPGPEEPIELDFSQVLVVAPSWLDEVLTGLRQRFGERIRCVPTDHVTLAASLDALSPAT